MPATGAVSRLLRSTSSFQTYAGEAEFYLDVARDAGLINGWELHRLLSTV
ncbi:MAG: hypothetical protein WD490_07015 [Opitutales bacterium]